jgi:hypothetical protein
MRKRVRVGREHRCFQDSYMAELDRVDKRRHVRAHGLWRIKRVKSYNRVGSAQDRSLSNDPQVEASGYTFAKLDKADLDSSFTWYDHHTREESR